MDPVSAVIGIGTAIIGGAQKAKAARKRREAGEIAAETIEQEGARELEIFKEEGQKLQGAQRAGVAHAGAKLTSGSALQLFRETQKKLREDEEYIKKSTKKKAELARAEGSAASAGTMAGIAGDMLNTGLNVYGAFRRIGG